MHKKATLAKGASNIGAFFVTSTAENDDLPPTEGCGILHQCGRLANGNNEADDIPGAVPIISWCGSTDTRDIILPTYDNTHSTLETLSGISNDLLSVQGNTGPPWSNKTEQALFCGRDSREERLHLVTLSKKNPELRDARITGWFFFREREKDLGKANLVGFFDFFKGNDDEAQGIAKAGQTIVRQLVQPNRLYCYYYSVLQMYSERQTNEPTLHPDMKLVPQPSDQGALCSCQQEPQRDDPSLEKDEL
ncbi:protein O-glucosyltransferase 3 [Salmo trutta]|uniref:protein O-glucosyltransferase 3 n=1 Tax=Salmo trutta TaxID=8032 RepID=UPI001130874F|nr:protein O-glucosyltransferase 3-like [Salmo trutta]